MESSEMRAIEEARRAFEGKGVGAGGLNKGRGQGVVGEEVLGVF